MWLFFAVHVIYLKIHEVRNVLRYGFRRWSAFLDSVVFRRCFFGLCSILVVWKFIIFFHICCHSICKTLVVLNVCVLFEYTKIQKLRSICILLVNEVVDQNFEGQGVLPQAFANEQQIINRLNLSFCLYYFFEDG